MPLKPTLTPRPTPTATPVPTPLPLPKAPFDLIWAGSLPGAAGAAIWAADPGDVGSRREVLALDEGTIYQLAASPDGARIAFTAAGYGAATSPLWLVNPDGSDLRQVAPDAAQLLWSPSGAGLAYSSGSPDGAGAIDSLDLASGEVTRLVTTTGESLLSSLLGWSEHGERLYFVLYAPQKLTPAFEIRAVSGVSGAVETIAALDALARPVLSPGGDLLLYGDGAGNLRLLDLTTGATRPVPGRSSVIWDAAGARLLGLDFAGGALTLVSVDAAGGDAGDVALAFAAAPQGAWQPLSLSPGGEWLAALHPERGYYLLDLRSGLVVPVPAGGRAHFSWLRK